MNITIFYVFFKEVSSAQQACIYLIQSRPTAKQYNLEIFSLFKITFLFEYILFIIVIIMMMLKTAE